MPNPFLPSLTPFYLHEKQKDLKKTKGLQNKHTPIFNIFHSSSTKGITRRNSMRKIPARNIFITQAYLLFSPNPNSGTLPARRPSHLQSGF